MTVSGARQSARALWLATTAALALAGCSGRPVNTDAIDAQIPTRNEAINNLGAPGVITLETEPNAFWTIDYDRGDALPNAMVGPITAEGVSVASLVDSIGQGLKIGVVRDADVESRTISLRDPSKRSLKELLEIVSRRTGLFYEYRNGMLSFDATRRFTVRVPRVEGSLLTLSDGFRNLGAQEVFVDEITGTITMTVDYRAYRMAQQFLRTFEMGRDMLVYDVWVFERTLRRGEGAGIWWERLGKTVGDNMVGFQGTSQSGASSAGSAAFGVLTSAVGPAAPAGGLQFGILSNKSGSILNAVIQAMSEDAQNQTVARPTMTMMSGGSAEIRIGERRQYIARVRNTTTGSLAASTQQDVEDETLETGLILRLAGAHNDGVINTKIDMNIEELVRFETFSTGGSNQNEERQGGTGVMGAIGNALGLNTGSSNTTGTAANPNTNTPTDTAATGGGTTLRLPYTTNRTLRTMVDARPGDLIALGGLIRTKAEEADRRFYRTTVPLATQQSLDKYETIMFMRPRLVRFRPRGEPPVSRDEIRVPVGVGQNIRTETGPLIVPRDPRASERAARDLSVPARPRTPDVPFGSRDNIFNLDPNEIIPRGNSTQSFPRAVAPADEPTP